ncbi:MAG: diphthine--ammonia ligase [Nanoarchaeota archaeon]|nr:diphthine--ammonia ligase [Nanoarchaeota archaeon]MBU1269421.1 diphthine--ammonia ligase [Nanoarchaeota archaeon]MBU1603704.1 diphthine--ammonia ligase [Nanoarchaeota archaeon]MBU2442941.1 diphthine--ammonia ligase [Nanoarchaeota archaeon]
MCGIIGVFGRKDSMSIVKDGLKILQNRGKDAKGFYKGKNFSVAHCLHSIVGRVKQPLIDNDIFLANCEIYNWKELNEKYSLKARNDSEMLFKLLQRKNVSDETLEELDGVYAFAYINKDTLWLARDIIGEKPIWYNHTEGFSFASEKKALEKSSFLNVNELNPRKIIEYKIDKDKLIFHERKFFSAEKEIKENVDVIARKLEILIKNSISKRIPKRKFGLLFSGGIDSTMIALILKKLGQEFTCYTAVLDDPKLKEPEDLVFAKMIAKNLNLNLKIIKVKLSDVESYLKKIVPLIEDSNVVKVGVALPFYTACEQAKKDGCKVLLSGLGSEEIFAGYQRHKESTDVNKECISGLLKLYERDLYRDDVVTMYNGIELRLPFLDKELIRYALKIPAKYKLFEGQEKYILRVVAKNMGLKEEFALRKKKAAQYGSNFHKALDKLKKKSGYKTKSAYLKTFYAEHNLKLGALVSSGKDSIYAMYTMMKQNYSIECMITIQSDNKDSYMFHTPTIELVELQSKAIDIPLIIANTKGEKERELTDLKTALKKAKDEYGVQGIITGALFSNYQRERIEKICDSLSLKIFSPLWHINQESEMREIVREGFEFIITKVAAEGLSKKWLNKRVDDVMIDELVKLNEKISLNIAGEGGEFETLVLDGPIFNKKIIIQKSRIKEEDKNTATMIVEKAGLIDKNK